MNLGNKSATCTQIGNNEGRKEIKKIQVTVQ